MPISKTVRTPWRITALFFLMLLLAVPMALITAEYANASPSATQCKQMYYDSFFKEIEPSPCDWRYPIFTRQHIREMEQLQRLYALPSSHGNIIPTSSR